MRDLPAVRGLREDLSGAVDVLLLNIHQGVGPDVLQRFDFRASHGSGVVVDRDGWIATATPLYLAFDAEGDEVLRSSRLPARNAITTATGT